ncbi:hypothetical protein EPVG_00301 [Emiliania huxleyi virus 201]|nr:hypothetical protein ELVG_00284 [Emiliania huxleyi virus 203]AEP15706.1 hypothetical protein EQVG_00296 [Emiliania huxleyi virus 207]AEP16148.1 hypothetical protein ERVG_00273 [Emiliania huxleyi virus 208]AET98188.1 hypothetical protein EPVG_00301 [Emiliania huxleyi virus 201]
MPIHNRTVTEFTNETMHLAALANTIFNDCVVENSTIPPESPPPVDVTAVASIDDDESPTDANVEKLLIKLTESTEDGIATSSTCDDVISYAISLLRDLRHKKAALIKKERRADTITNPRERAKYRTNAPTPAMLFCNNHRAEAGEWYDSGGRIEGVRESRPSQIQRRLANQWKFADSSVRIKYRNKANSLGNLASTVRETDATDDDVIVD